MHLISYCFAKWCGGLMANVLVWIQQVQGLIPLTNIYYVE